MLVLSRKIRESIFIGEEIEIYVAEISRGKVRLGIAAPTDMKIVRSGPTKLDDPQGVKMCRRCNQRPADGSTIMCTECWIETGDPVCDE